MSTPSENGNTDKKDNNDKKDNDNTLKYSESLQTNPNFVSAKPKKSMVLDLAANNDNKNEEEKKSSNNKNNSNSRGIPAAIYLKNPYEIVYKNQHERYLREIENVLGKYQLMENQLIKQKVSKQEQLKEVQKNIEACNYLQEQSTKNHTNGITTQFEVADQLYSEATITEFDNVAIWLGANVMLEFPTNEAITFLGNRCKVSNGKIAELQTDIDFCRKQMNIVEVNRSRVYNANVKIKKARGLTKAK